MEAIAVRPAIRWAIRRDMPAMTEIERLSFEFPWTEQDFTNALRHRNCIGMVIELGDDNVVGFFVYELFRNRIHVLNLAVHPNWRRMGLGTTIVHKLRSKLSPQRRTKLVVEVRETNLAAQLFFRSCEFKATKVLRDYYKESPEDCYLFEHRLMDEE